MIAIVSSKQRIHRFELLLKAGADFLIFLYNLCHIFCAAIADVESVSTEYLMKLVRFWEVFVYQFEKYLAYVRFDVFVARTF